jgi:hypothetical protein
MSKFYHHWPSPNLTGVTCPYWLITNPELVSHLKNLEPVKALELVKDLEPVKILELVKILEPVKDDL